MLRSATASLALASMANTINIGPAEYLVDMRPPASPAEHLEGVVAGTPEHPVGTPNWCLDMISMARSQALLLSERESEIERLKGELYQARSDHAATGQMAGQHERRAESAEARLQQARHTLSLFALMVDFPGDPKVAAVLRNYRDAARTTLAAIQGDSHER